MTSARFPYAVNSNARSQGLLDTLMPKIDSCVQKWDLGWRQWEGEEISKQRVK